jgi:hypothetical protein
MFFMKKQNKIYIKVKNGYVYYSNNIINNIIINNII